MSYHIISYIISYHILSYHIIISYFEITHKRLLGIYYSTTNSSTTPLLTCTTLNTNSMIL